MGSTSAYTQDGGNLLPAWVPDPVVWYLDHTQRGTSLRALARNEGRHASTILRQVRRFEQRRDDPLVDSALDRLSTTLTRPTVKEPTSMTAPMRQSPTAVDEVTITKEAKRILRRLCEKEAFLAIANDLERAIVMKEISDGPPARIAVVDRPIAEAFVLKDWISCTKPGRVATYHVTHAGRAALKRMLAEVEARKNGFAEAQAPFSAQHQVWGEKTIPAVDEDKAQKVRCNLAESPLALLARRKDKNGQPFLTPDLVAAGERLREDFELAQMGPRVTQNWDRFLIGGDRGGFNPNAGGGSSNARDRVAEALRDLGPGLGDVVLRCCCYLEGMETAEKRMGWSARSGKIVLRIALQRLKVHYDGQGESCNMIG